MREMKVSSKTQLSIKNTEANYITNKIQTAPISNHMILKTHMSRQEKEAIFPKSQINTN